MKRGKVEFWKLHSCLEDQICIAQEWRYLFDDLNNHIEFGQPLPSNIKNRISNIEKMSKRYRGRYKEITDFLKVD